jgi:hypothetical protein
MGIRHPSSRSRGDDDEVSCNDIVKNLGMISMGGLEGRKDKPGFQIDAL